METVDNILKKKLSYTEDDLTTALNYIGNGMSIRKAASACGIPYPTVRRRLIKNTEIGQSTTKRSANLTKEEKAMLRNVVLQHEIFSYDNYSNSDVRICTYLSDFSEKLLCSASLLNKIAATGDQLSDAQEIALKSFEVMPYNLTTSREKARLNSIERSRRYRVSQRAIRLPKRVKNNEEAEGVEIDGLMTENSANGWKGNAFSSDVSETETNAHDWKPTTKTNEHVFKKRKVHKEDSEPENNRQANGFLSSLATCSKDTAPFDWTANNALHARSGCYEAATNNQDNTCNIDAVMETLDVCKTLLQQQTRKNNTQTREEIFCNYLCTEIKKVTSEKIFQKLKLDILQLVNIALEADPSPSGSTIIQDIKVEPEIIIDSHN